MKKMYFQLIVIIVMTLITLTATILAWFAISNQARVNDFNINATSYEMNLKLKINDEVVSSKEEISSLLNNAKPNDIFNFKLELTFKGNIEDYEVNILLYKISSSNENILGEFYIKDIKIDENIINNEKTYLNEKDETTNNLMLTELVFNYNETKTISFDLCFDKEGIEQEANINIEGILVEGK